MKKLVRYWTTSSKMTSNYPTFSHIFNNAEFTYGCKTGKTSQCLQGENQCISPDTISISMDSNYLHYCEFSTCELLSLWSHQIAY